MRSRTFLNVALGIVTLAVAYHLGARSATAQSAGGAEAADIQNNGVTGVVIARQLWEWEGAGEPASPLTSQVIPGSAAVIACGAGAGAGWVLLANGEEWKCTLNGPWSLVQTWPFGTTAVRQESLGSVKVRYR